MTRKQAISGIITQPSETKILKQNKKLYLDLTTHAYSTTVPPGFYKTILLQVSVQRRHYNNVLF